MGFLDRLSGTQKADPGVVPVSQMELWDRLMRLNDPARAWLVRAGSPEGVDLVAEWKGDDPAWRRVFDGVGLNLTYQVHMRFDPEKTELRVQDRMIDWVVDTDMDSQNRRVESRNSGNLRIETTGHFDGVKYTFTTMEMKDAIKSAVTGSGWTHRAVIFRKV